MSTYESNGGCLCGSVRYAVRKPASAVVHCHCSRCRKGHASLITTCAVVERVNFSIRKGQDALTKFTYPPEVDREFCFKCGCSIVYRVESFPNTAFYYPATLDEGDHPGHPDGSEHHIYIGSKAEWEIEGV